MIASRATEDYAFQLLTVFIVNVPLYVWLWRRRAVSPFACFSHVRHQYRCVWEGPVLWSRCGFEVWPTSVLSSSDYWRPLLSSLLSADWQEHIAQLLRMLGERLVATSTLALCKHFVRTVTLLAARHGSGAVSVPLESLGAG
jgi:hypothetical protein